MSSPWEIRPMRGLDELREAVRLQREVWGGGFSEEVPVAILRIALRLGGVCSGAWRADGVLCGLVFGLTGWEDGEPVHWSDLLAVRAEERGRGLGRLLKLHQRDLLLARGVRTVYWTFDPLRALNAHLNLRRLGAEAIEYIPEMYGETGSPLHRAVGTDRFLVRWRLDAGDGEEREWFGRGRTPAALEAEGGAAEGAGGAAPSVSLPRLGTPRLGLDASALRVPIPSDLDALLERDPALASEWRAATREVFEHYLARGYACVDFERGEEVGWYLLRGSGGA